MTDNELAIERLKDIKTKVESIGDSVALDMAILAISAIEKIRADIIQDVQNGVIQIAKGSDRLFEIIDKHIGG